MSRILIVDDEQSIQKALTMALSDQGFETDAAPNGLEAIKCLQRKSYDLVLSDIRMPGMDGFELLKSMREKTASPPPVIFLTAYATMESTALALAQGARDLIVKPFEIKTLLAAVNYVLKNNAVTDMVPGSGVRYDGSPAGEVTAEKLNSGILDEISDLMGLSSNLQELATRILTMVQQIVRADYAFLAVYGKNKTDLRFHCAFSSQGRTAQALSGRDRAILEWVTANRRALYLPSLRQEPDARWQDPAHGRQGALLAVPFKRRTQILGVLALYCREEKKLTPEALQFITILASMAAANIENSEWYGELKLSFAGTMQALLATIEAKDAYTFGHSQRVARYALLLGKQLELAEIEIKRLEYLALLHDIGKIAIPENILCQKASLTAWEYAILKTHCDIGEKIVKPITFLPDGARIIRHHHEHFDGKGYPDNLAGENIPQFSRIISIANIFDLLTSDAPRRPFMTPESALLEMLHQEEKQFDPLLLRTFVRAYREQVDPQ